MQQLREPHQFDVIHITCARLNFSDYIPTDVPAGPLRFGGKLFLRQSALVPILLNRWSRQIFAHYNCANGGTIGIAFLCRHRDKITGMSGPLRILCAEDNEQMGEVLIHFLTQAGHVAIHARDGLEAWAILLQDFHAFDVLITDHQMPGMSGLQLAERAHQAQFAGKIIVHSANVTDKEATGYRACGVRRILPKMASGPVLLQAIEAG